MSITSLSGYSADITKVPCGYSGIVSSLDIGGTDGSGSTEPPPVLNSAWLPIESTIQSSPATVATFGFANTFSFTRAPSSGGGGGPGGGTKGNVANSFTMGYGNPSLGLGGSGVVDSF